jgi:hypothetical protein
MAFVDGNSSVIFVPTLWQATMIWYERWSSVSDVFPDCREIVVSRSEADSMAIAFVSWFRLSLEIWPEVMRPDSLTIGYCILQFLQMQGPVVSKAFKSLTTV